MSTAKDASAKDNSIVAKDEKSTRKIKLQEIYVREWCGRAETFNGSLAQLLDDAEKDFYHYKNRGYDPEDSRVERLDLIIGPSNTRQFVPRFLWRVLSSDRSQKIQKIERTLTKRLLVISSL